MSSTRALSVGSKYSAQIRREFDVLLQATDGVGASSLIHTLAAEAVLADTGRLTDSTGAAGFAWNPAVYEKRNATDPVAARIASAGASLGRVLAGGHPTHRTYLAYLEAIYQVTVTQGDDVAARIERLWDQYAAQEIEEPLVEPTTRPWYRRLWARFVAWWSASYTPTLDEEEGIEP